MVHITNDAESACGTWWELPLQVLACYMQKRSRGDAMISFPTGLFLLMEIKCEKTRLIPVVVIAKISSGKRK
jgi:hypothetical protein